MTVFEAPPWVLEEAALIIEEALPAMKKHVAVELRKLMARMREEARDGIAPKVDTLHNRSCPVCGRGALSKVGLNAWDCPRRACNSQFYIDAEGTVAVRNRR